MKLRRLLSLVIAVVALGCFGSQLADAQTSRPKADPKEPSSPQVKKGGVIDVEAFHCPLGKDWEQEKPSNQMRVAQVKLPAPKKSEKPAELIVFYFGAGQGGDIRSNVERWKGQFEPLEGASRKDFAKETRLEVDGMKVTVLEVRGKFVGMAMPGRPAPTPISDARLYSAIVETSKGSYFIKATGPSATIDHHRKALEAMVAGIKKGPHTPKAAPAPKGR